MIYIFHLTETDGDIHCEHCNTVDEVQDYIKQNNLDKNECFVVEGEFISF